MPTYGYNCPDCGHEYEKMQKITDTTRAKCPQCGVPGERVITGGAGIVFKGSGFYETDYKRAAEKSESADTPATEKKDAEAKPKKDSSSDTPKSKAGADS
ncbi:MAG: FmdB family zinc ribbon protein [Gemmatimonadales bacterium]